MKSFFLGLSDEEQPQHRAWAELPALVGSRRTWETGTSFSSILGTCSSLACCDCTLPIPEWVQICNYQYNAQASSPQLTLPYWVWLVRFWSTQSLRFQQVSVYLDLKVSAILQGTSLPLSKTLFPARADFKAGFQLSRCRGHHTGAMRKQRLGKLLSAWNTAWFGKIIIMIIITAVATAEVCHWKPTILNNCDS